MLDTELEIEHTSASLYPVMFTPAFFANRPVLVVEPGLMSNLMSMR